ncbi:MAG TPA: aromatic ring-hydroxylating dioxygenase subunit alpha [Burkholderiales bacterium]|nr:aromatic ring-hydroxylating dioxygenase subunit alpha [Burkholderiales bacterium]
MTRQALGRLEAGLPAGWYHDPAHYQRELEAFWYRGWIAVAREEELAAPGDWRVVRVASQSLFVVRGEHGEVRAFHNTCRHRGSVLCTQDNGSFARHRIVCPYHSWTYDLAGSLVATPRRMQTPDFRLEDFPLYAVAVETWGGFVFVNLAGRDAPPLLASLGELPQRFARYGFEKLRIGKRIVTEVRANWKLVAENFSECFHCPPVHPELCRVVSAYRDAGAWGLRGAETTAEYAAGAQTLTLDGRARIPPISTLAAEDRKTLYVPAMLPPALFLNVHPDYVNAHLMTPTGPESVRIVYDWLFEADRLPLAEADLQHYVALWDITNRQDARNCEWQQEGLQSREFKHGYYVPQEFDCHRFAQWVRAGLAA